MPAHSLERIVPTGTTEVVISLATPLLAGGDEGQRLSRIGAAMVVGSHATPFTVHTGAQGALMGIHFKPGGAFPFFAEPASRFRDARIDLGDVWGRAFSAELRERLGEQRSPIDRFAILERALLSRMVRPLANHPAVAYALDALSRTPGLTRIAAVRERTGLSARRFIELFEREVGLTPKLFARVGRLQDLVRRLDDPAGVDWVDRALVAGFFDQSHLIRDFREFVGLTPTAYLARRTLSLNHVAILPTR